MSKKEQELQKLNEQIKLHNSEFKKMSAAQKRIAIAKDVLASLKAKKYTAKHRTYCAFYFKDKKKVPTGTVELQDVLLSKNLTSCNVCAMGSVFMAKVSLGNSCKIDIPSHFGFTSIENFNNIVGDAEDIVDNMKGIFTEKQLREIEYAFEGEDIINMFDDKPLSFHDKMKDFYIRNKSADVRLKAIMDNIVENEGTFKL